MSKGFLYSTINTLVYPILNYGTSSMVISASQVRNVEVQVNNMR